MIDEKYKRYLKSEQWDNLRRATLRRAGYKCEGCGCANRRLEVHHRHYRTLYHESLDDLQCLCAVCHRAAHGRQPSTRGVYARV
jgi:5-methylcytosine-specific restriction endonuclease McrA